MNTTFTLIVVIAVLCFILYAVVYKAIGQKKEIKHLKNEIENYKRNLLKYLEELSMIKKDEKQVEKEIKNAETDEEVYDIMADIVSRNNNRVSDNKAKN